MTTEKHGNDDFFLHWLTVFLYSTETIYVFFMFTIFAIFKRYFYTNSNCLLVQTPDAIVVKYWQRRSVENAFL